MKLFLLVLTSLFLITACSGKSTCNIPSDLKGNGGCLITYQGKFLAARHRAKDKWNLPGGTWEAGESSQCTAARETKEEVGLDVQVGELLWNKGKKFYLFDCTIKAEQYKESYSVPLSGITEVSRIEWLSLDEVTIEDWRHPKYWPAMEELIKKQLQKQESP